MRKHLKRYLVPHHANDFRPHLLRESAVLAMLGATLILFIGSIAFSKIIQRTDLGAAIYSSLLVDLANKDRAGQSLTVLTPNPLLEAAARMKAEDMAAKGYFAHQGPGGEKPWYWMSRAGYRYLYAGENLAIDFVNSEDVEIAWMNSPGHRANILNGYFTEIGIATAEGVYEGRPTTFVVQMFGKPLAVARPQPVAGAEIENDPAPVAGSNDIAPTTSATAAPTSSVAGTTSVPVAKPKPARPQPVETIVEDPTFIAVRAVSTGTPEMDPELAATTTASTVPIVGSTDPGASVPAWQKVLVSPAAAMRYAYGALAALIGVVTIAMLAHTHARNRHPRSIAYGALLAGLCLVLMYLATAYPFSAVVVL
jgi:hypothetical protein